MKDVEVGDTIANLIFKGFVEKQIKDGNFNNDDDWYSFNDNIDVNIWVNEDNEIKAAVYPVVNGRTDTTVYKEIVL